MSAPDQVIVVTGSGGAMGGAVVRRLLGPGAAFVLNDRRASGLEALAAELKASGTSQRTVVADVSRPDGTQRLIDAAVEAFGQVDVLVNVVGGIAGPAITTFWEITEHDWDTTLRVNLSSAFYGMRAVAPLMLARRTGRIVNIASVAWAGDRDRAHYAAAKAGLVALTRSASDALAPYGITVNAVAPGRTNTGWAGRTDIVLPDAGQLTGRDNEPADIAEAVAYFVSPGAAQVSGQLLTVAGGRNPSL